MSQVVFFQPDIMNHKLSGLTACTPDTFYLCEAKLSLCFGPIRLQFVPVLLPPVPPLPSSKTCCVCPCVSHQCGNWARSDDRPSSPLPPARGWEYTLSSSQGCLAGDSPQSNPHRGHITGPLVQLFHLRRMPLACPWFIQPCPLFSFQK